MSTLIPGRRAEAGTASRYELDQAVAAALQDSPLVRSLEAQVEQARGQLEQARTYPFNPEVGVGVGRRQGETASVTDYGVSVSQEIEIAGQRGKRARSAVAELAAAEAQLTRAKRRLAAEVALAFSEAVRERSLLEIEQADAELATQYATFTRKRFEAGATSQIERNLGEVSAGRADRQRLAAEAAFRIAQSALATAMGLDPVTPVEPVAPPSPAGSALPPLAELLRSAAANRADLAAFEQMVEAAHGRRQLARAEAIPNLSLEGFIEREDGTDTIAGVGLSIGLPLFNRNRGAIVEATAGLRLAEAEKDTLQLAVQHQVVAAHARYASSVSSLRRLEEQVLGTLRENLELLERAFTAGKIGSLELLVFRREFVQSRRDHAAAMADAWQARIALDLATGATPGTNSTTRED